MNLVNPYWYNTGVNTYIGGVASIITSASNLATRLGISSGRIKNFSIIGNDVRAFISGTYVTPTNAFISTNITYYCDMAGLVTDMRGSFVKTCANFKYGWFPGIINMTGTTLCQDSSMIDVILEFPNCITMNSQTLLGNYNSKNITLVTPKLTNIGLDESNNNIFAWFNQKGIKWLVPIAKQTSNSGGVEGDVAYVAAGSGSSIVYVSNFTCPNNIINLSSGTITSTTVQLIFTAPSSVNGILNYQVWVDGHWHQNISASGDTITGLTTATEYSIEVKAVDIFYNKSISNTINLITS